MKYFTLVGSRETPQDAFDTLKHMAWYLALDGWVGRSGGADGADSALEMALLKLPNNMEVYLPWNNFNGRKANGTHLIDASKLPTYNDAMLIAEHTHPAWEKCSRGARSLHARNVYQVLGRDLQTPSNILICWAIPTTTGVKGGTNTAVQLAKQHGCRVINICGMDDETAMSKLKEVTNE